MKFNTIKVSVIVVLAVSCSATALAQLEIEEAHVRASLPASSATVAYMTLINTTDTPLIIKAVTAAVAGEVTLHQSMNHNGMVHMMGMSELEVAAHARLSLAPEGTHIMLEGVAAPLQEGDSVVLSFHFADGRKQDFSIPVISVFNE